MNNYLFKPLENNTHRMIIYLLYFFAFIGLLNDNEKRFQNFMIFRWLCFASCVTDLFDICNVFHFNFFHKRKKIRYPISWIDSFFFYYGASSDADIQYIENKTKIKTTFIYDRCSTLNIIARYELFSLGRQYIKSNNTHKNQRSLPIIRFLILLYWNC